MKLLIVDDHPIVRSGLRRLLSAEPGLDIVEAANGQEAIAAYKDWRPDLVILDLNLPGISGLEVLNRLKIENPKVRALIRHHVTCHWPEAQVTAHPPESRGPLPPEFLAQGYDVVLLSALHDGQGLTWLHDLCGRRGFAR